MNFVEKNVGRSFMVGSNPDIFKFEKTQDGLFISKVIGSINIEVYEATVKWVSDDKIGVFSLTVGQLVDAVIDIKRIRLIED